MIQFGLRLHDAEKLPVEQVLPLVRQKGLPAPCGSEQILQGAALHPQRPRPPAMRCICGICLRKTASILPCWATT